MRKTNMLDVANALMTVHYGLKKEVPCTDGTKKGAENHLFQNRRLLLSSSEVANTLHLTGVPCPKICLLCPLQFLILMNVSTPSPLRCGPVPLQSSCPV